MAETETILAKLREAMPNAVIAFCKNPSPSAQHSLLVDSASLLEVCKFLRDGLHFDFLSNVTGVDWPDAAKADLVAIPEGEGNPAAGGFIEVLYHLYSTRQRIGPLVLRARTQDRGENAKIPSVVAVFRSAEFQEREIFDLFGVHFIGHPDLRRILMWDEFVDHPMRKDYVAPDDYEYEPTPHDEVLEKAKRHYTSQK
ncbi:MAG: NADH-quinone oxidoreductase subunit C [Gloeobacteraceae cyanobacterium ES-bin-144]|nr:NADH-quinone oxidoreductase subunit C [Verrucomicrobiales bacterium]